MVLIPLPPPSVQSPYKMPPTRMAMRIGGGQVVPSPGHSQLASSAALIQSVYAQGGANKIGDVPKGGGRTRRKRRKSKKRRKKSRR